MESPFALMGLAAPDSRWTQRADAQRGHSVEGAFYTAGAMEMRFSMLVSERLPANHPCTAEVCAAIESFVSGFYAKPGEAALALISALVDARRVWIGDNPADQGRIDEGIVAALLLSFHCVAVQRDGSREQIGDAVRLMNMAILHARGPLGEELADAIHKALNCHVKTLRDLLYPRERMREEEEIDPTVELHPRSGRARSRGEAASIDGVTRAFSTQGQRSPFGDAWSLLRRLRVDFT